MFTFRRNLQNTWRLERALHSSAGVGGKAAFLQHLEESLEATRGQGTYKEERIISSAQSNHIQLEGRGQTYLNFCSNNYLGLSNHPRLIQSAKDGLDSHGFGLSSVRFICGTQDIHKALEKEVAALHGMEDAILYAACFDANAGLFEAILDKEDAVISDELNHASIIDGIRLCKAQRHRYKHRDMADLEAKLRESASARMRLVVTDGAFSMDGTIAPLDQMAALCRQHDALLVTDECHSAGLLGDGGGGVPDLLKCKPLSPSFSLTTCRRGGHRAGHPGQGSGGSHGGIQCGTQGCDRHVAPEVPPLSLQQQRGPPSHHRQHHRPPHGAS